jgi:hypothetical protein
MKMVEMRYKNDRLEGILGSYAYINFNSENQ